MFNVHIVEVDWHILKESTAHYLISLIWWDLGLCNCTLYFCVDNIFPSKETNLLTCKWDLQLNTCTCLRAKIHYLLLLLIKVNKWQESSLQIKLNTFFLSIVEIVASFECQRYLGHFSLICIYVFTRFLKSNSKKNWFHTFTKMVKFSKILGFFRVDVLFTKQNEVQHTVLSMDNFRIH